MWPGHVAQTVTCLTADPGVASLISAHSNTFPEIDHEIISTTILLPSADSRGVVASYKRKYVHDVLVNCLVKLAREKSVVMWIDRPNHNRSYWLGRKEPNQTKNQKNLQCMHTQDGKEDSNSDQKLDI